MYIKCLKCKKAIYIGRAGIVQCAACGASCAVTIGEFCTNVYPFKTYNKVALVALVLLCFLLFIGIVKSFEMFICLLVGILCLLSAIEYFQTGTARTMVGVFYKDKDNLITSTYCLFMLFLSASSLGLFFVS